MGKNRASEVQLENHVESGIAYAIAQTAVVCGEFGTWRDRFREQHSNQITYLHELSPNQIPLFWGAS